MSALVDSPDLKELAYKAPPNRFSEILSDAIEEELPEILASIELPPPLTDLERLIGRKIEKGEGSFRASAHAGFIARLENEPILEEIRQFQHRVAVSEYGRDLSGSAQGIGAATTTIPLMAAPAVTTKVEGTQRESARSSPGWLADLQGEVPRASTEIEVDDEDEDWWRTSPSTPEYAEFAIGSELTTGTSRDVMLVGSHGDPQDNPNRIGLDTLVGGDLQGAWVILREGHIEGLYRSRPAVTSAGVKILRIPRSPVYKAIQYGTLLERLETIGLGSGDRAVLESGRSEMEILNALLETVDLERQWDRLNDRRQHLILKKYTSGLDDREEREYVALQDVAERRLNKFSPPLLDRFKDIDTFLRQAGLDAEGL